MRRRRRGWGAAAAGGGRAGDGGSGGSTGSGDCSVIAQETAGLYPADGSNGATMGGGSVINARVYESLRRRRFRRNSLRISQLAMTQDICEDVFEEAEYAASVASFSRVTLAGDNVWSDGWEAQTPAFTGSVSAGYVATVTAAVPA